MNIAIDEVGRLLATAASRYASDQEARYFSDCIVASQHLRKSPRMLPINEAISDLNVWNNNHGRAFGTLVDNAGVTIFDFNGLAPSLKIQAIHDELSAKPETTGSQRSVFETPQV